LQGGGEVGELLISEEVQRIAQQRPPLAAGSDETDVIEGDAPVSGPERGLAPREPGRADLAGRADDPDVVTPSLVQVTVQLCPESGRTANLASRGIHDDRKRHGKLLRLVRLNGRSGEDASAIEVYLT
jgi:hypothetical protein